ncbi:MAG: flagellar biosynthetic protein FliQ [Betaproteobacteria bacterium]|nr:flagellar biosynthetic protein FliQ [Betaproteobacteria bacterium]NDD15158.1 flagellar biosynthetic protein FliQ [Betaproteobacteria bacterium]
MDSSEIVGHVLRAILMMALLAGPILIGILLLGLVIGVLQAATSVNEQTLTFVPKLIITALIIGIGGSSMLSLFVDYVRDVLARIPALTQ